jgi:hypothetical protein
MYMCVCISRVYVHSSRPVLMAIFCLTGVPVYGLALGQGASLLVATFEDNKLKKDLAKEMSESEFQVCMCVCVYVCVCVCVCV